MYNRRSWTSSSGGLARPLVLVAGLLLGLLALGGTVAMGLNKSPATTQRTLPSPPQLKVRNFSGRLPLTFERNDGQTDARVKFISRGEGYTLFLTPTEAIFALRKAAQRSGEVAGELVTSSAKTKAATTRVPRVIAAASGSKPPDGEARNVASEILRIQLVGANPTPKIDGRDRLTGKSNYFVGNDPKKWHTNIPNFSRVNYRDVYPGIDLAYYSVNQRQLEYDFVLAPGADPRAIGLRFEGAERLTLNRAGDLIISLADGGEVIHHAPVIYQERDGQRERIEGKSVLRSSSTLGFELTSYDHRRAVFIDPGLSYSTYLGGTGPDLGEAIAVDSLGFAYVTGLTSSSDFPVTAGAFDTTSTGGAFAFVTKLATDGSGPVYSTYLESANFVGSFGIAVDSGGSAYITGNVGNGGGLPVTTGAFQTTPSGGYTDAFVTKFSSDGSKLAYSTYLGGTYPPAPGVTKALGIAVDALGNAYVTGTTSSGNFPVTTGAFQIANACVSCNNAFVTKFTADGTGLDYSTYLGGTGSPYGTDGGLGIAVDSLGFAYVTGSACSTDFPTTGGAFKTTNSGFCDVFATKLKTDGTGLVYSTYLGGSQPDQPGGIGVDAAGHAYVAGSTQSNDFPTTAGAFQTAMRTIYGNAFVTELKTDGSGLVYSTYLGGYGDTADSGQYGADNARGIAVDPVGHAYVTGATWSSNYYCAGPANPIKCCSGAGAGTCNFPITADAFQTTDNASNFAQPGPNAFVTKMNLAGSGLDYSTYLGGSDAYYGDYALGIAIDSTGDAYVTGAAYSNDFPVTAGAFQTTAPGNRDAFATKLIVPAGPTPTTTPTATLTPTSTPTATPTTTPTATLTPTSTASASATPTGTATATVTPTPTATPTPGALTTLTASPGKFSFGNVSASTSSKTKTLTLTNVGAIAAVIGQLSPPAAATPSDFVLSKDGCSNAPAIAPKKKCKVAIAFAPVAPGPVTKTLVIPYNGTSPAVTLTGDALAVTLTAPKAIAFPGIAAGGKNGKAKSITISNRSRATVVLTTASAIDPNFTNVTDHCAGATLTPAGKCVVSVQFTPSVGTTGQPLKATLSYAFSYGVNAGNVNVPLSGTAK